MRILRGIAGVTIRGIAGVTIRGIAGATTSRGIAGITGRLSVVGTLCRVRIVFEDFDDDTDELKGSTLHVPILHEAVTDIPHSVQMTGVVCVVFD